MAVAPSSLHDGVARVISRERLVRIVNRPKSIAYEGPHAWLWFGGMARIAVLSLAASGAYRWGTQSQRGYFLMGLYAFALITGIAYLVILRRSRTIPLLLTWTQMLLDFSIVTATISFTGGIQSSFTFLLVIVILEAGLLLGLAQGFLFATLATLFMCAQAASPGASLALSADEWMERWYRFLIQGLAFYLTAFVSGYWNQRIHRMEQFQRDILDNMNSGFLTIDPNGIIVAQNRAANEILAAPEGAAVGKPVDQVLRVASGECPLITALRSRRDFISYEFFAVTGSGETKLLGLTTSQISDPRGNLMGLIASFTDLTEIARMRQELQSQDRLAAVGELAAGLAHEVRNPVAAIRGAVDELQGNMDSPGMMRKLAAIAIRESDHLNEIVSGFLDFARSPSLKRERFDLRDIVTEVRDLLLHEYANAANLRIVTTLPSTPCPISGAPTQIKQVFINLGKNAIEAMEERGTLTITMAPSGGSFETRFDDEGPGIPPDKVTRIFEPFYSEKERGVGMGLAICSRMVTAHDGTIRAGAREGGGASMTVRLPAAVEKT